MSVTCEHLDLPNVHGVVNHLASAAVAANAAGWSLAQFAAVFEAFVASTIVCGDMQERDTP